MGSRIMHLLTADYLARELGIAQREPLFLGAIAPDAAENKRQAHFKADRHAYANNAPLNWAQFISKYNTQITEPFFIGYLSHLIMDDVWTMKTDFSGFEKRIKTEPGLYETYHGDLRLCNAKLIEHYGAQALHDVLAAAEAVPALAELQSEKVLAYKQDALDDFHYPAAHLTGPLQLFTFEEMIQYVERSMSKALDVCRMVVVNFWLRPAGLAPARDPSRDTE